MNKPIIICLVSIIFYFSAIGQDLGERSITDKKEKTIELFNVLKSDTSIRHGRYNKFYKKALVESGNYHQNEKDSVWLKYNLKGKVLRSRTEWDKGKEAGIWEFYDSDGIVFQKVDMTEKKLLYTREKFKDVYKTRIIKDGKIDSAILDRPPVFIGDKRTIKKHISKVELPGSHSDSGYPISYNVIVSFWVTKEGDCEGFQLRAGYTDDVNRDILEAVKTLPRTWLPAIVNGENVTAEYSINFGVNGFSLF